MPHINQTLWREVMRRSSLFAVVCSVPLYNRHTLYCTMGRTRNPKSNTGDDEISEGDLSEEVRLIVKIIERKFDTIVTKLTEELQNRDCEVNDLRSEVNQLRIKLGRMEEKIDDADAYERRDTITLSGNDDQAGDGCDGYFCSTQTGSKT